MKTEVIVKIYDDEKAPWTQGYILNVPDMTEDTRYGDICAGVLMNAGLLQQRFMGLIP